MAEWSKALVLKTSDRKVRGFESHSLRQLPAPRHPLDRNLNICKDLRLVGEVREWLNRAAC